MRASHAQRAVLSLALLCCFVKGLFIAAVTPPFQTPDEYGHYDYVLYLSYIEWDRFLIGDVARPTGYNDVTTDELWAVTRATRTESHLRGQGLRLPLPGLRAQLEAASAFTPSDTHQRLRAKTIVAPQFNYPVLYYGAAAALVKATRLFTSNPVAAYHVVRSASLVLTLLTVYLVWRIAAGYFASWPPVAMASMFVALHPQLGMLGTSVQSDVLTTSLTTLAGAIAAAYAAVPTRRRSIWLGVSIGLLLLTKVHAAAAVAAAVAILIVWVNRHEGVRAIAAHLVPAALTAAVIGLWWYVRAYLLYQSPTGMVGDFKTAQFAGRRHNIRAWLAQWRLTFESFWGMWGWLEVALPRAYYSVLGWLSAASVLPVLALGPSLRPTPAGIAGIVHGSTLTLSYVAVMAVVAAYIGPVHNNQGRHWLPLISVIALVLAASTYALQRRSRRLAHVFVAVWCLVLCGANIRLMLDTITFYGGPAGPR